jgi:hypothetical protein
MSLLRCLECARRTPRGLLCDAHSTYRLAQKHGLGAESRRMDLPDSAMLDVHAQTLRVAALQTGQKFKDIQWRKL